MSNNEPRTNPCGDDHTGSICTSEPVGVVGCAWPCKVVVDMANAMPLTFADQLAQHEHAGQTHLSDTHPVVLHLTGVGLACARGLIDTTEVLLSFFNARVAYTRKSEIFVVLLPQLSHMYAGNVQKLCSLAASKATAEYNHNQILFDCRAFSISTSLQWEASSKEEWTFVEKEFVKCKIDINGEAVDVLRSRPKHKVGVEEDLVKYLD